MTSNERRFRNLIPQFIRTQYERGRLKGRFRAATLFTDVSGFTALTEMLMQHGRDGAEALTDALNAVFAPLVRAVYANAGFISTFAGDAFTAFFPVRRRDALLRAAHAAFLIREFFDHHPAVRTKYGDLAVGVKSGLGVGSVRWDIVGRGDRHAYCFRGEAVRACSRAEGQARRGEIVAAPGLMPLLGTAVQAVPVGNYFRLTKHRLVLPASSIGMASPTQGALRPFVHEAVIGLSAVAEFRNVASAFISLEDPEDEAAFESFVGNALELAAGYGGYFNRLHFGDKGGMILVVFGAPVGYENNLERAADFLLALRSDIPYRAGLTHGTAYAGFLGGEERSEYTAIGDIVNLSARLAMKAPWGGVWTSPTVKDWLEARGYRCEPAGEHTFKGKSRAVQVSRLVGRRTRSQILPFQDVLVGRADELETLARWVQPVFRGEFGGLVHVHGEAGIGKSHLIHELQQRLSSTQDVSWFVCPADGILRQSLNPFKHLLRSYFDQSPDRVAEDNKSRFGAILDALIAQTRPELGEELERTRPFLGALVDLYWEGSLYDQVEPGLRHENTLTALRALILAESLRKPLVLHVEDSHWLDEDSLEMLALLTRNVSEHPLALLVSGRYRDDGSRITVDTVEEVPRHHLDLGVLPPDEVRRLACHVLQGEIADAVTGNLAERTNGNPFFVEQLVLDLRERGALVQDAEGVWGIALQDTVEVPTSIGAVLVARVDRLATRIKAVVQTAAVLGREFEVEVLSRMLKDDADVMTKVKLAEAEAIWSALDEIRYVFRHALLRDAAYDMQLRARLRELHALAGSAIEEVYASDLTPYHVDLAYHYRRAELADRERTYARLAGEHALAVGSYREALHLLERTLELVPDEAESERTAVLKLVGDVHFNQGAYPLAGEYFQDSLELAERTGDAAGGARARQGLGSIAVSGGDYVTARAHFEQNLAAFRELDDRKGTADSIRHIGLAIQRLGDNPKAKELFDQSLAIHRDIKDEKGVTSSLISLGDAIFRQGDYAAAGAYWEEALAICRRRNDRLAAATALNNLGNAATELGDISRAQACFEESLAIRREIGDREGTAASLNNLAYLPYTRGDYEAAQRYVQQSLEVSREVGKPHIIAMNLNNLGMFADLQGQYDEARSYYDEGLAIARRTGDSWNIAQNLCGLGSVALKLDDIPQAEKSFREVLGIAQKGRANSLALEALSGFARLYRQVDQTTRSAELLELVDRHPATAVDVKQDVLAPLRSALENELAPDDLAAALERGRSLDLDAEVSAILGSDEGSWATAENAEHRTPNAER